MMDGMNKLQKYFILWIIIFALFMSVICISLLLGSLCGIARADMLIKVYNSNFAGTGSTPLHLKTFKTAGILFQRYVTMKGRYWAFFAIDVDDFGNIKRVQVFYMDKPKSGRDTVS